MEGVLFDPSELDGLVDVESERIFDELHSSSPFPQVQRKRKQAGRLQLTLCPNGVISATMKDQSCEQVWTCCEHGWSEGTAVGAAKVMRLQDDAPLTWTPSTARKLVVLKSEHSFDLPFHQSDCKREHSPVSEEVPAFHSHVKQEAHEGHFSRRRVSPTCESRTETRSQTKRASMIKQEVVKREADQVRIRWQTKEADNTREADTRAVKTESPTDCTDCGPATVIKTEEFSVKTEPGVKAEPETTAVKGELSTGTHVAEVCESGIQVKLEEEQKVKQEEEQTFPAGVPTTGQDGVVHAEEMEELPEHLMMEILDCVAASREGQSLLKLAVNNNTRREEYVKFSSNISSIPAVYRKQVFARLLFDPQMKGIHNRSRNCSLPSRQGMPPTLEALVSNAMVAGLSDMAMDLEERGESGKCHWHVRMTVRGRALRWRTSACAFCASNFSRFMHESAKYAEWRLITRKTKASPKGQARDWAPLAGWTLCEPCYGRYRNHGTLENQSRPHHSVAALAHAVPWDASVAFHQSPARLSSASLSPSHPSLSPAHLSPGRTPPLPSESPHILRHSPGLFETQSPSFDLWTRQSSAVPLGDEASGPVYLSLLPQGDTPPPPGGDLLGVASESCPVALLAAAFFSSD